MVLEHGPSSRWYFDALLEAPTLWRETIAQQQRQHRPTNRDRRFPSLYPINTIMIIIEGRGTSGSNPRNFPRFHPSCATDPLFNSPQHPIIAVQRSSYSTKYHSLPTTETNQHLLAFDTPHFPSQSTWRFGFQQPTNA